MGLHAEVRTDETMRAIDVRVTGAAPIENRLGATYRKRPRPFEPRSVLIEVVGGQAVNILLTGPVVLTSGSLSERDEDRDYWVAGDIGTAPEWVQTLWREAPQGVTSWSIGSKKVA
jgi:hypothetical protein